MSFPLDTPAELLLVQLTVILALARAFGALARRLGQPVVVAEIAAGIVLGPSVLGAVAPEAMSSLFPLGSLDTLHALSQLALVLFLFLVGLRLDASKLFQTARTSLVVSQASMIAPFVLGLAAASWLYDELSTPDVPFPLFALFLALSLSVTALPVLARLLRERHLLDTRLGVVAVASAAIDDVAAWAILAIVVSVVRAGDTWSAITTSLIVAALGIALFGLRPALTRLAERTLPRQGITDGLVTAILVGVLAAGVITEMLGIHALFVAFACGAVMPREGGLAQALGDKIEDVTTLLLLPLFFGLS
jgi:Kef-type K+ transport system membrane component KefB